MSEPRKINTNTALGRNAGSARPTQAQQHVYHAQGSTRRAARPEEYSESAGEPPRSAAGGRSINTTGTRRSGQPSVDGTPPRRRPPQDGCPPRSGGGRRPRKKKGSALKITLITLAIIVGVFGIAAAVVLHSIAPKFGSASLSDLIHTPKEFSGDVVNILVCGIDWEENRNYSNDASSNDGMTDMILYVNFDVKNKEMHMLQIPRNTLVTSDRSFASNYQINSVALSNGGNVSALAQLLYDQFKLPVDYYVTIDMQSLAEIVDTFGGIEVYVPHDIEYAGSALTQGYQTMNGAAAEFFVRNRKGDGYNRSDLDRLNMQRYFYSALLRRFRTMTVWDAGRLIPVFMNYVTTDVPASTMVSLGVSVLNTASSSIMMCQLPVYNATSYYNDNSVVVAARQEDADLLNQYFRTYTGEVSASELGVMDYDNDGNASDANVQFMGQLDAEASSGQQNENLDGSFTVVNTPEPTAEPEAESKK